MARIGVALSGGGHRATAWGLGVLAALVESGANADVVSVASVSGGSIANGAVAAAGDFRQPATSAEFADRMAPLLRVVAREGLFFPGRATKGYVTGLLACLAAVALAGLGLLAAVLAAGRETSLAGYAVGGAVVGGVLGWKLARATGRTGGGRAVVVAALAAVCALVAWGGAALTGGLHGGRLWLTLALLAAAWLALAWVAVVVWSGRGRAVEKALADGLLGHPTERRPLALADVASPVNHVLCATDLESGDQFYLAPRFLYGYREGVTTDAPARVTLAAAVQASAALPMAFPPSVIETGPFTRGADVKVPPEPPTRVVLADGGVYDNMADQWEGGLARRLTGCPPLRGVQEPAEVVVVANASEDWEWNDFTATSRMGRELLGLQRDQAIQYDVSTARRRSQLYDRFTADRRSGRGPGGVIVMVDRSPLGLAEPFTAGSDDIAARARQAVAFLEAERTEAEWDAMAARNAKVATTLGPIGAAATLDLMEHAYTSTVVGLHVLHGIGGLRPFPRRVYEERLA